MLRPVYVFVAALALLPPVHADDDKPTDASAHVLQAEIALSRGEYLRAVEEYRKAAELGNDVEHARRATLVADSFGFSSEALRAAKRWSALDEQSEEARWYLARLQLRTGDKRSARRSFTRLLKHGNGDPDQRLLALVQALADEDEQDAHELVVALAKPYPDSPYANYAVAITALGIGDDAVALKRSQKAIELDPEWLKPKLLYGRALMVAGREDEAIDYVARIIGDDPDPDPEARMELAVLMMTIGRDEDALSQVNQVLLEQPSRTDALRLMAIINYRMENLDAAWDDFEDLLETGRYRNDALYYLARIADYREDYEQAVLLYKEIRGGAHVVAAQRRSAALLAYQLEAADEAVRQLDDFAHDNPGYAIDIVLAKAQLLASLERHDEALAYYDEMIRYRPDTESVALGRAELLLRMDRLDDALSQYRQAARRWPDSAVSLNALGYTLADRTDKYREAERLIRKALKIDPDSAAIIDSLGWVLYKRGRHADALVELEKAYALFDDPEVAAHLVEVLYVLERREEALELLAEAERKDPGHRLLEDVRERMFPEVAED